MADFLFILCLALLLSGLMIWGFKHLPKERWQMLAVIPLKKENEENWLGVNVTYYGFFVATSLIISLVLLFILLHAASISIYGAGMAIIFVLAFAMPSAKIVAMIVEGKRHTFTTGGASFVGIILAPWVILSTDKYIMVDGGLPVIPLLAAMSIAYTLGEGLGRLGCISYGCCYGKPVKDCGRVMQFLFKKANFIFHGSRKKVSYEADLQGEKLVPIQGITYIIYSVTTLLGCLLYLNGHFMFALLFTTLLTQFWRIFSEFFRADFRGISKITAYQKLGLLSSMYIVALCFFFSGSSQQSLSIVQGIEVLWNPGIILLCHVVWLTAFFMFGRSTVTSSKVSFSLIKENI